MYNNPLFWEHGIFLQPQHFQIESLNAADNLRASLSLLNPYMWGVRRCVINEDALVNGIFEVTSLELLLPTGEWVYLPENAVLPPGEFKSQWSNLEEPLMVYLTLPVFQKQGHNATRADSDSNSSINTRFLVPQQPENTPDYLGDGPTSEISVMRFNLHVVFSEEAAGDNWRMPFARLYWDGAKFKLDPKFIPPCLDLNGFSVLFNILRDLRDTLVSRASQLDEYKILPSDVGVSSISSMQGILLFSVLGAVCRNVPEINSLLSMTTLHPFSAYNFLCRLVGELSVFVPNMSPLGKNQHGIRMIPEYNHEDIYNSFFVSANLISRLIDSIVVGPTFSFLLEPLADGELLGTVLPQNTKTETYSCWLLVRSAEIDTLKDKIIALGKLAATADLKSIVGQALPGIHLIFSEQAPAGLPRKNGTLYFMIDSNDPLWHKALQSGEIAFLLPDRPDDLSAQLVFV